MRPVTSAAHPATLEGVPRDITPEQSAVIRAASDEHGRPLGSTGVMIPCPVAPPAEMTIISIEEWTSHIAIHWWFSTPTPSTDIDLRLQDGLRWIIIDDAGVSHLGGDHGGGGGNSPRSVCTAHFAPALAPNWTRLDVSITSPTGGDDLTVQIDRPEAIAPAPPDS